MSKAWYGHFDSTPDDKRALLAEDWARYIRGFVTDGIRNGGTCMQVSADTGMKIKIDTGIANIQGYVIELLEDELGRYFPLTVPTAHVQYPRIDRVVLRLDRRIQTRNVAPVILQGTAAASPVPPVLTRNDNIWELSLAQVRVPAGALSIVNTNITDERMITSLCGLMNSVLGLDPSAWQTRFDLFLAAITAQDNAFLEAQATTFQNQLASQQTAAAAQQSGFTVWYMEQQTNLAKSAQFDFENLAAYPGNTVTTTQSADGTVTTVMKNTVSGKNVAIRTEKLNANGTVTATETVYKDDGTTVLRSSAITATVANGVITEVVNG